ncbi:MAG: hypothetical protein ACREV7_12610 [Steroidobacteraceae bacterium]
MTAKASSSADGNHRWQHDIYIRVMLHLYCDRGRALRAIPRAALIELARYTGPRVREHLEHFTPAPAARRRRASFDRIRAARPIAGRAAAFRR